MDDRLRLLPREFLVAWISVFKELPPEDFLRSYEMVCEGLYFGFDTKEDDGGNGRKHGKHLRPDYFFANVSLLYPKGKVDERLAAIATSLQRWQERRAQRSVRRPG